VRPGGAFSAFTVSVGSRSFTMPSETGANPRGHFILAAALSVCIRNQVGDLVRAQVWVQVGADPASRVTLSAAKGPWRDEFLVAFPAPIPFAVSVPVAAAATRPSSTPVITAATAAPATAAPTPISIIGRRRRRGLGIVPVIRQQRREPKTDPKVFTRHRHERLNAL
jgi:predicted anti-sigma-YlaC factor YlaD